MPITSKNTQGLKDADQHPDSDTEDNDVPRKSSEENATRPDVVAPTVMGSATGASPPQVDAVGSPEKANNDMDDNTPDYKTGATLALAMLAINLSVFLTFLDNSILSTAIPTITDQFHSTHDIGWYISSYQLALSALQPTTGKLFTYLRNKWTYIIFLFVFEVGSLICGLAQSTNMLIAGRAVAGLGASGLFNGALTIISALVPLHKRPTILGAMIGFGQLGLIAGPLLGGAFTEYSTWRWCFYINLPIGGVSMVLLALVHIPEQRVKPSLKEFIAMPDMARKFDLIGTVILAPAVVMLLLALEFGGNDYPWGSSVVIGLFIGAVATFAVFFVWEWRVAGEDGIIPLSLFKQRVVVAACLTNLCLFGVTFIAANFVPLYFQSVQGVSAFTSGIHLLPNILSQLVTTILSGFAVSKIGYYLPWSIFSAVLTTVGCGLLSTWSATTTTGEWIGYQIIFGAGRGAGLQMAMLAVQTVLPDSQVALVMAILVFVQGLGGSIFVTVANTLLDNSLVSQIHAKAPGVNAQELLAAGATAFRKVVPEDQVNNVIDAYAISLDNVFYLTVGLSVALFFAVWGMGWGDVRKKQEPKSAETEGSRSEKKEKGDTNV